MVYYSYDLKTKLFYISAFYVPLDVYIYDILHTRKVETEIIEQSEVLKYICNTINRELTIQTFEMKIANSIKKQQ